MHLHYTQVICSGVVEIHAKKFLELLYTKSRLIHEHKRTADRRSVMVSNLVSLEQLRRISVFDPY